MLGPSQLDLAKTLADEHRGSDEYVDLIDRNRVTDSIRHWAGRRLIAIGERLTPRPTDLQLKVSTGPPCP